MGLLAQQSLDMFFIPKTSQVLPTFPEHLSSPCGIFSNIKLLLAYQILPE